MTDDPVNTWRRYQLALTPGRRRRLTALEEKGIDRESLLRTASQWAANSFTAVDGQYEP